MIKKSGGNRPVIPALRRQAATLGYIEDSLEKKKKT
jgi:hypothetical protein